jgi:2-oxoglutarate dehydrogenase E1 component
MSGPTMLSPGNLLYLEALHAKYRTEPTRVDKSWHYLFEILDELERTDSGAPSAQAGNGTALRAATIRLRGHEIAHLDPLSRPSMAQDEALLTEEAAGHANPVRLMAAYCGSLTLESAHIDNGAIRQWLYDRFETLPDLSDDERKDILHQLVEADTFEALLKKRYPTKKRFGAEGAEAIIPMLHRVLSTAAATGVKHVVIATMHRGRLNIMANVLRKPLINMMAELKGRHPFPADFPSPGDVPYHLGFEGEIRTRHGPVRVTLVPNPSHLEAVNAVGLGRTRASQDGAGNAGKAIVLPIVIHTDAAVAGQGVVSELIQMGGLSGFDVGGTIHIVINNQIGFTTNPIDGRTSKYCTGPWKAIDSAILHVNGDDPEAACRAVDVAVAFRQEQCRDAVIDLVCYRRNGHNEIDEPAFTQPLQYAAIEKHPTLLRLYSQKMITAGIVKTDDIGIRVDTYIAAFRDADEAADINLRNRSRYRDDPRAGEASNPSGYDLAELRRIGGILAALPNGFEGHSRIHRILNARHVEGAKGISWPLAEALAFGSLLRDGIPIRLTGQDVARGTFSHRHLRLIDQKTGEPDLALNRISPSQAGIAVIDSPLSEYAVLAFEYGYSLERPDCLVVWEAQFGDFANGAQIAIDQFVTSGMEKWCSKSALVMLLPHGLEGQGPEHSSARLERFLQMAANDNVRICNPSTPANYFHMLRRQALSIERKPLIVMAPKKLLRLPAAVSAPEDFAPGTAFQPIIMTARNDVDTILLCSGKIAYELEAERSACGAENIAIIRFEQLYPFPAKQIGPVLDRFRTARVAWVQEEPENMGAWTWMERQLRANALDRGTTMNPLYIGRPESSSPAGSFHSDHDSDQSTIVKQAIGLGSHMVRRASISEADVPVASAKLNKAV